MGDISVSVEHKNECRTIGKAKKENRDDLVDGPNDKIGLYRLYLEKIMSKA